MRDDILFPHPGHLRDMAASLGLSVDSVQLLLLPTDVHVVRYSTVNGGCTLRCEPLIPDESINMELIVAIHDWIGSKTSYRSYKAS